MSWLCLASPGNYWHLVRFDGETARQALALIGANADSDPVEQLADAYLELERHPRR
jgi:hypothetical protein